MASPASKTKFYRGTGRRKTSVARVRLTEGTGKIIINGKDFVAYFNEDKDRYFVEGPLLVTDLRERVDVVADVKGGGATGQAGAVGQGLARAIKIMFGLTLPQPLLNPRKVPNPLLRIQPTPWLVVFATLASSHETAA